MTNPGFSSGVGFPLTAGLAPFSAPTLVYCPELISEIASLRVLDRLSRFTVDGERYYPGWHDPSVRWNGWACPRFARDTAIQIAKDATVQEGDSYTVSDDGKAIITYMEGSGEPERFEVDDDGLFHIGASSWTWEAEGDP